MSNFFIYGRILFFLLPKLWTKKKFWTGRGGEDSPSPNSILWDLDVGRKFWLPVEMLLVIRFLNLFR
jgi:hypothetical protein